MGSPVYTGGHYASRISARGPTPRRRRQPLDDGESWLLLIYSKNADDNIPAHVLREVKEELENA